MASDLDGTAHAGSSSAHQRDAGCGPLQPSCGPADVVGPGLLLGALSALVMFPAAQHLRSLKDGERAEATLYASGACMAGQCEVEFEAGGRTVVADLPVGSGGGRSSVGARMTVRYQADDPEVVAREEDVGGGGLSRWWCCRAGPLCSSCRSCRRGLRGAAVVRGPEAGRGPSGRAAARRGRGRAAGHLTRCANPRSLAAVVNKAAGEAHTGGMPLPRTHHCSACSDGSATGDVLHEDLVVGAPLSMEELTDAQRLDPVRAQVRPRRLPGQRGPAGPARHPERLRLVRPLQRGFVADPRAGRGLRLGVVQ
ncbi:hypothetical protein SMICM17S_12783 [Streptomyces microflavus]